MKKEMAEGKILSFVAQKPRRWNEIRKEFKNIPKPSLVRYINNLYESGYIDKRLIDGKVHYRIGKLPQKERDEIVKNLETAIKLLEILKKQGLFSKGLNEKEILELLKSDKTMPYEFRNLNIIGLLGFLSKVLMPLGYHWKSDVKVRLKIEGDPSESIKDLKNKIKEIKS